MSMKTILLPTDYSEHSRNAIEYALALFKGSDQRFLLMNAYYMPHAGAVIMTSIEDILRKSSEEEMELFVQELTSAHLDMAERIDHTIVYGDPYIAIQSTLKEHNDVGLIVMGTTGASGIKGILIGSVTAQIVKNAPSAVLAVPFDAEYAHPERIAFASDNSEMERTDLQALLSIAKLHGASIHVFNVANDDPEVHEKEPVRGGVSAFEGIEHDVRTTTDQDLEAGILQFVNDRSCDMLTIVHHRYSTIEQLFHKSASKQLALHTHVPLLVLKEKL